MSPPERYLLSFVLAFTLTVIVCLLLDLRRQLAIERDHPSHLLGGGSCR